MVPAKKFPKLRDSSDSLSQPKCLKVQQQRMDKLRLSLKLLL